MASKTESQETAMSVVGETKPFEIVEQRFPVIGQDRDNPFKVAAFATLAYCPTRGGRVARSEFTDQHGGRTFHYWTCPESRDEYPTPLHASGDWGGDLHRALEESSYNVHRRLHRVEPTPEERDIAAFAATHPYVAERLGLTQRPARRLFDVGPCFRPVAVKPGPEAEIDWQGLIDKHASGDWGLNGRYRPELLADREAEFLVGLSPIDVRNNFACAGKWPVVRSAFEVPGGDGKHAMVSTCFVGRAPLTVGSFGVRQPNP